MGILLEKTDRLNTSIENLRSQRAGQLAGPQSFGLAKLVGTGQDSVRIDFRVPLARVIGSVRCFGLLALSLVFLRGRQTSPGPRGFDGLMPGVRLGWALMR